MSVEVFTPAELKAHSCWPMLSEFTRRAARAGDEGPAMAAWTTLAFHHPNPLSYWRSAVPGALADAMAGGGAVTPAGWRALAWLLSLPEEELKERVSYAMMPDGEV